MEWDWGCDCFNDKPTIITISRRLLVTNDPDHFRVTQKISIRNSKVNQDAPRLSMCQLYAFFF